MTNPSIKSKIVGFSMWSSLLILISFCFWTLGPVRPEQTDFLQYWTAVRLSFNGQNFYDAPLVLAFQKTSNPALTAPIMYWGAPWLLFFLWPLGLLPLPVAFICMSLINVAALMFSLKLCFFSTPKVTLSTRWGSLQVLGILGVLLAPLYLMFSAGQMSGMLTLGCCVIWESLRQLSRASSSQSSVNLKISVFFKLAVGLLLLSLKPHLFLPLFILVGFQLIARKAWQLFFSLGIFAALVLMTTNLLVSGGLFAWTSALDVPQSSAVSIYAWVPAAPAFEIRRVVSNILGSDQLWVQFLPCWTASLAFAYWSIRERNQEKVCEILFPWGIAVGLLTAPYGWTFDLLAALPWLVYCTSRRPVLLTAMVSVGLWATFLVVSGIIRTYDELWWLFPALVLMSLLEKTWSRNSVRLVNS